MIKLPTILLFAAYFSASPVLAGDSAAVSQPALSKASRQGSAPVNTADLRHQAVMALAGGQTDEAIRLFKNLAEVEKKQSGPNSEAAADAYHGVADCYFHSKQYSLAQEYYRKTVLILGQNPKNKTLLADSLHSLARIEEQNKRYVESAALYRKTLMFADATKHADMAETWLSYGNVLAKIGLTTEAQAARRKAEDHKKAHESRPNEL